MHLGVVLHLFTSWEGTTWWRGIWEIQTPSSCPLFWSNWFCWLKTLSFSMWCLRLSLVYFWLPGFSPRWFASSHLLCTGWTQYSKYQKLAHLTLVRIFLKRRLCLRCQAGALLLICVRKGRKSLNSETILYYWRTVPPLRCTGCMVGCFLLFRVGW